MCGENYIRGRPPLGELGSSPRVRGKLCLLSPGRSVVGLIPACAGKTWCRWWSFVLSPAHPRVCGENINPLTGQPIASGSSPRVRGKPPRYRRGHSLRGLIPACAGKTPDSLQNVVNCRAHPRVCGENELVQNRAMGREGSSPRVRGKLRGL